MDKYDFKTKCRALFLVSLSMLEGQEIEVDEKFFNSLNSFTRDMMTYNPIYFNELELILYYRKNEKHKLTIYENEKTIQDLYNIIDEIKGKKDLIKLYNSLGQRIVDRISNLVTLYTKYLDEFDNEYYFQSKLIQ